MTLVNLAELTAALAERDAARAVVERVEAVLNDAESGAGIWGTCSGEWLRIDELRKAIAATEDQP